jgi:signal transduction histidine kinase
VLDEQGNISFFVGLERDVTKEKEIDEAKSEFISLASHQMRTPLTAINWYTEMLLDGDAGKLTAKQKDYFKEIYTAGQQMNEIIKSFLHILRLETGTVAMNPISVDLPDIVRATLVESQLVIEKKKLHVIEQYPKSLPPLLIDKELVRVVLQNFISNAAKYTPEKGEITIAVESIVKGGIIDGKTIEHDSLLVSVHDTGIGIAAADHEKIFTKFFRADAAKRWDPNGNGIGLYMARKMVDIIGGSLWFTSEEGKGATFCVLLPIDGKKLV